jgi:hypothetical protein
LAIDNETDDGVRRKVIDDALLELLRSLLGKPCRLADEILALTGFPSDEQS